MINIIIIIALSFMFGSVLSTMLISNMYASKVKKEEIDATQNRGDNMNGLSNIKELSIKRFYKAIASVVLVSIICTVYGLGYYKIISDMFYVYIALGVFLLYVLLFERTITLIHIPVIKIWKSGAPKRKEKKEYRKTKKAAEAEQRKFEAKQAAETHEEFPEGVPSRSHFPKKPTQVNPPQSITKKIIVSVEDEEEAK